jgi:hypothetical protein
MWKRIIKTPEKMKLRLLTTLPGLIPFINYGQSQNAPEGFGLGLNYRFNGVLDPIRMVLEIKEIPHNHKPV